MAGPLTQLAAKTPGITDPTDASVAGWVKYLTSIPEQADASAELTFPGSARDSSVKNAYRHSLGTGLLAQNLGAGEGGLRGLVAPLLAKLAGYGWEAAGLVRNVQDPTYRKDTYHDLNANAIGAQQAGQTRSSDELASVLKAMALQSVPTNAPGPLTTGPGYLTRTER